jgi:murein DD-endopeptidase MepM/ murein hydrolase activator NlpD
MWYKIAKFNSEVDNFNNSNDPDSLYGAMTGYIFSIKQKTADLQKISDAFRSYKNKLVDEGNFSTQEIEDAYDSIVEDNNLPANDEKSETNNDTGDLNFKKPLEGKITSNFGPRDAPMEGASKNHQGIDIDGNEGGFVIASESGTVTHAGLQGSYGNLVIIDHGNNRQTRYAHLSRFNVKMGQTVKTGDILGFVGTTGQPDIAPPHLHFEVRSRLPGGWVAQDPLLHLPTKP